MCRETLTLMLTGCKLSGPDIPEAQEDCLRVHPRRPRLFHTSAASFPMHMNPGLMCLCGAHPANHSWLSSGAQSYTALTAHQLRLHVRLSPGELHTKSALLCHMCRETLALMLTGCTPSSPDIPEAQEDCLRVLSPETTPFPHKCSFLPQCT